MMGAHCNGQLKAMVVLGGGMEGCGGREVEEAEHCGYASDM